MEAGKVVFSSCTQCSPRTHHRVSPFSTPSSASTSVLMLHEQAFPAFTSGPTSITRHFPTSLFLQEQRDGSNSVLQVHKDDRVPQGMPVRKQMDTLVSVNEEKNPGFVCQSLQDFRVQLNHYPCLCSSLSSSSTGVTANPLAFQPLTSGKMKVVENDQVDAVSQGKKALLASKEACLTVPDRISFEDYYSHSLHSSLDDSSLGNKTIVRSLRLLNSMQHLERRSKKRIVMTLMVQSKQSYEQSEAYLQRERSSDVGSKTGEVDGNHSLKMYLLGPKTMRLTLTEENERIVELQGLVKLEDAKKDLRSKLGREPTLSEWAESVELSSRMLLSKLHSGYSSRDKLIYSNLRLVVHIAEHYQRLGLDLPDLMQAGSAGLLKSVERFKREAGVRFETYAYFWIRHMIREEIYRSSRLIRLPRNVHDLLGRISKARRSCKQEGNHRPTNKELAMRVGLTVEEFQKLMFATRKPTLVKDMKEIEDTIHEPLDMSFEKEMLRQHVQDLLDILNPRERFIIRLRFGMDGVPKVLEEIGKMFGMTKERVRQIESRAMEKLKQGAYERRLDAFATFLANSMSYKPFY